ncbi:MAG: NAD-dependent deacylase [Polyangiaceae bacterium]
MTTAPYDQFAPLEIGASTRVFILTGAGISAESGIATFRDVNGLWEKFRVEDVASPEGWARDAEGVWRFYSQRRAQAETCAPNAAHRALGDLERAIGTRLFLCTQNVDPLHERGGSTRVSHMHGELFKSRCEDPRCAAPPFEDHATYLGELPRCNCGKRIRPHICWFGEMPFKMQRIERELDLADVFVTIGSSGAVYPAAGFVRQVRQRMTQGERAKTIYVGPEAPDNADEFDECRLGKAGDAVPRLFEVI